MIQIKYQSGEVYASIRSGIYTNEQINDTFSTIYEQKYFIILNNYKIIYSNLCDMKLEESNLDTDLYIVFLSYDYDSEVINLLEDTKINDFLLKNQYRDKIVEDMLDELQIMNDKLCYIPNTIHNLDIIMKMLSRYNNIIDNIYGDSIRITKIEDKLLMIRSNKTEQLINLFDIVTAFSPFGSSSFDISNETRNYPIRSRNLTINFIFKILYSLKDGGKAGIIIPRYILYYDTYKLSRKYFIIKYNIYKIVDIDFMIDNINIFFCIIYIIKGGTTKNIEYNNKIIDIEKIKQNSYCLNFNLY